jgi:hypothetical protein
MNDSPRPEPSRAGAARTSPEAVHQLVARLEEEQRTCWQRGERVPVEVYLE